MKKGIHWKNRTIENLKEGELAYVSFDKAKVHRVRILKILKGMDKVEIEIIDEKGKGTQHILWPDEVRLSPEDARLNCVTL